MDISLRISEKLNLKVNQVDQAIKLLDEGSTIPFIARYRKEVTGNLTDADLRDLYDLLVYFRNLAERINTVLSSIESQGKLTEELKQSIETVETLSELEDIYRPYKPKRKTRASIAKERGLEPLANYIKAGNKQADFDMFLASFVNNEKGIATTEDALSGALYILAEEISEEVKYRKFIKSFILKTGQIVSLEMAKDEKDTYGKYADYKERLSSIPPHRILAIYRGEKGKCLKVSLDYAIEEIENRIKHDFKDNKDFITEITLTIKDSLKRLILPSVENEIRNDLFVKAEDASILVFKKNLQALLLYPPLKNKTVLGFDPGFRTGCKYALINPFGIPMKVGVVYLTANSKQEVEKARQEIKNILLTHAVDYIALGNGTASRESEQELNQIISEMRLNTKIFIVNESGASVYSASKVAEDEFPDLTVEKRSAISLARRLQDPLNELVKIEPKAIGIGQYQHDMNQAKLQDSLYGVVENCVNTVGVNLNNASMSILNYVAGINKTVTQNIYEYIKEKGPFKSRNDLRKVPKLGDKAFQQCAGFLRIYDGLEPLDQTAIHPESYAVARYILNQSGIDLLNHTIEEKEAMLSRLNKAEIMTKFKVGNETLLDIIDEIKKPGRDIRDDVALVTLNSTVRDISDLKVGMVLEGTVRNIMDFGMFVDINVHQDGLVHISEISNSYIRDISAVYTVNDIVKVKVISLDTAKKRIGLSIKQVS